MHPYQGYVVEPHTVSSTRHDRYRSTAVRGRKRSVYFTAAVAIAAGDAGVKQFTDEWVRQPAVVALRDRVAATVDPSLAEVQARAVITLKDGRRLEKFIEHAVGSVERPMSDRDLDAKVRNLCDGVLPATRTRRLIDLCRTIEREPQARVIADVARL